MFDDENEPVKKTPQIKNLEPLSIDELQNYIQEMKSEIIRTEEEIKRKRAHLDAASSIFK
jgi:uncharacterized small protein (DUF1192 family)